MATDKKAVPVYLTVEENKRLQENADRARVSKSTYLSRAGSIVNLEDIVKYPLSEAGVPAGSKI